MPGLEPGSRDFEIPLPERLDLDTREPRVSYLSKCQNTFEPITREAQQDLSSSGEVWPFPLVWGTRDSQVQILPGRPIHQFDPAIPQLSYGWWRQRQHLQLVPSLMRSRLCINTFMKYCVYWIHYTHFSSLEEGYIGITSNLNNRLLRHRKSSQNQMVASGLANGAIVTCIFYGDKEACLSLEEELRPRPRIGWNIAKGGGIPPKFTAHSDESKEKIRQFRMHKKHSEESKVRMSQSKQGEKGSGSKLTPQIVLEIRERLKTEPVKSLIKDYGISQAALYAIKRRISWKNI